MSNSEIYGVNWRTNIEIKKKWYLDWQMNLIGVSLDLVTYDYIWLHLIAAVNINQWSETVQYLVNTIRNTGAKSQTILLPGKILNLISLSALTSLKAPILPRQPCLRKRAPLLSVRCATSTGRPRTSFTRCINIFQGKTIASASLIISPMRSNRWRHTCEQISERSSSGNSAVVPHPSLVWNVHSSSLSFTLSNN